jgi:hypothetical protein
LRDSAFQCPCSASTSITLKASEVLAHDLPW